MTKTINKWYARDREVLTGIAKVGFFKKEDIDRFYNNKSPEKIHSRHDSLLNGNKFITERPCQEIGEKVYVLTEEGRNFVKDRYDVTAYTFKSHEHDNVLRETYLSYSREERYRTMSEPDFRNYVKEEINLLRRSEDEEDRRFGNMLSMNMDHPDNPYSLPDLATIKDEDYNPNIERHSLSSFTVTESITQNYTEAQIEAKISFAEDAGVSMDLVYTF